MCFRVKIFIHIPGYLWISELLTKGNSRSDYKQSFLTGGIHKAINDNQFNNQDGYGDLRNDEISFHQRVRVQDNVSVNDNLSEKSQVTSIDQVMANDISICNNSEVPAYCQGYRNAKNVNLKCLQRKLHGSNSTTVEFTVRWSKNKDVLYCPTYKIGTTFWRRVFMIQSSATYSMFTNPYEIASSAEYSASKITLENSTSASFKFIFTRNPYTRLYSFYIDKLIHPVTPYFWTTVGEKAAMLPINAHVRNSSCWQLSFPEFINYVIHTLETGKDIDPHWIPIEQNCLPCQIKYDFIGTLESFQTDVQPVLEKLGLSNMADYLKQNGKNALVGDSILDTLVQAFGVDYCGSSLQTNVQHAWRKLQMKGLIGEEDTLDITDIDNIVKTPQMLMQSAWDSRLLSESLRRELKNKIYKQYWKQISDSNLKKLEKLYAMDFDLFGYSQKLNID